MANKKSKNGNTGRNILLGAAAVAAAAGGYFLYGPKGKQHRKQIKGWTLKAKGEVLSELEKAKNVSEEKYHQIVDRVMTRYGKLAGVTATEIKQLASELKGHWKNIEKGAKKPAGKK